MFAVVEDDKDADADDDIDCDSRRGDEEEEEGEEEGRRCKSGVSSSTGPVPRGVWGHIDDDDSCLSSFSSSSSWPAASSPSTGIHFMFEARFCCISPVYRR